jgi:hypothetical protein
MPEMLCDEAFKYTFIDKNSQSSAVNFTREDGVAGLCRRSGSFIRRVLKN